MKKKLTKSQQLFKKRNEYVWNEFNKLRNKSKKPISRVQQSKIFKKLHKIAKRRFK